MAQAARVIGVSPKRIRQLIAADALPTVPDSSPTRVLAEGVHREREKRRDRDPSTPGPKPDTERVIAVDLQTLLDFADAQTQRAIEATQIDRDAVKDSQSRIEAYLTAALAEARDRAAAAELRAAAAEAEAAALRQRLEMIEDTGNASEEPSKTNAPESVEVVSKPRRWFRKN